MTATAPEARATRPKRRKSRRTDEDRLVPFSVASARLGRSTDTLRLWHDEGYLPAVVSPGKQWSTYESFIVAVLTSARPGRAGEIVAVGREWFAARMPAAVTAEAVA